MNETKQTPLDPESWVDEYGDYLFRYAMFRLRNQETAEDIVQETFLAALKAKERFAHRSSVGTWLIGILKHKIIDYFRTKYREQPLSDFLLENETYDQLFDKFDRWKQGTGSWEADPRKLAEHEEFLDALESCMGKMPERLAQAFALRVIEGLSTKEVCNIINVTTTNLNVMLHRARLSLRHCLEVNWFDS